MDFTAASVYGASPQAPSYGVAAPTQTMATDDIRTGVKGLLDPANPLLWVGALIAITVGFASVAGSARVGKVKVAAQLGDG